MLFSLVVCALVVFQVNSLSTVSEVGTEWENFKLTYKKSYASQAEEIERLANFIRNYAEIKKHNEAGQSSFTMGVNHLSDWSKEEVKRLRGFRAQAVEGPTFNGTGKPLVDSIDWRQKGAVRAVKNQGQCGSCWSFSTTGGLEGQWYLKKGQTVTLSEQQLVDCSKQNSGCNGGIMSVAVEYIKNNGGIESESAYPYVSGDTERPNPSCSFSSSKVVATATGYVNVPSGNEHAFQQALANVGPVSVAIDASHSSFQNYESGVYNEPSCSSTALDHGVLAVGYGTLSGQDYYIVKNSWGPNWGEGGYILMSRNKNNQCGIATMAGYPTV